MIQQLHPTNQFSVKVKIPFPKFPKNAAVLHWFNIQNCGRSCIFEGDKVSKKFKDRSFKLHLKREYEFVFEINAEGDWKFVGRKG